MCKCNQEIKSPYCGKPGCEWPVVHTEIPLSAFQHGMRIAIMNAIEVYVKKTMGDRDVDSWAIMDLPVMFAYADAHAMLIAGRSNIPELNPRVLRHVVKINMEK